MSADDSGLSGANSTALECNDGDDECCAAVSAAEGRRDLVAEDSDDFDDNINVLTLEDLQKIVQKIPDLRGWTLRRTLGLKTFLQRGDTSPVVKCPVHTDHTHTRDNNFYVTKSRGVAKVIT